MHGIVSALLLVAAFAAVAVLAALLSVRLLRTTRGVGPAGRRPEPSPLPDLPEPHPDLAPVSFLLGTWEGAGVGGYPTIESFRFGQEISFSHNGKPFLIYASRSWLLDEDGNLVRPLATETGYWRPQPGGQLELILAHPTGIAEIYVGDVTGTKIELRTDVVARTTSAKEVTAGTGSTGWSGRIWTSAGPTTWRPWASRCSRICPRSSSAPGARVSWPGTSRC